MKNKIIDSIGKIDDDMIESVDALRQSQKKRSKKKNAWTKWGAMAACLCLLVAGALGMNNLFNSKDIAIEDSADKNEVISDTPSISETQEPSIADTGLYIPAVELPDTTTGVEFDMLGLVVYNGGIYTQAENYYGAEALKIDNLIGKYLGYATGSINEWSTQEEYAEEFASSVAGKVYEVIGYDTDFRVCIREEVEDENGEKQLWIQFLDRLNGITLTTGEDLFETRLHLRERIANIQWLSHHDWNDIGGNPQNVQDVNLDAALWEAFLDEVDNGSFVYTWNPEISSDTIYDTENQAHIILTMKDGTVIRLRLIEGGYVGYDALGWYFVQIPGHIFDSVVTACGGNG